MNDNKISSRIIPIILSVLTVACILFFSIFDNYFSNIGIVTAQPGILATETAPIDINTNAITSVKVEWARDKVEIYTYNGSEIRFFEKSDKTIHENNRLTYNLEDNGEELVIKYNSDYRHNESNVVINSNKYQEKELVVMLPKNLKLDNLEVNAISSDIEITDLEAMVKSVTINVPVGDIDLNNLKIELLTINAVSADVDIEKIVAEKISASLVTADFDFEGQFKVLKTSNISGDINIKVENKFTELVISNTTGKITVEIPQNFDPAIKATSVSGRIYILDGEFEKKANISGIDESEITISGISSSIRINKNGK